MKFQRVFLNTLGLQLTRVTIIIRRHFRNIARVEHIHALSWSCTFQNAVPLFYGQAQIDSSNVEKRGGGEGKCAKRVKPEREIASKGTQNEWTGPWLAVSMSLFACGCRHGTQQRMACKGFGSQNAVHCLRGNSRVHRHPLFHKKFHTDPLTCQLVASRSNRKTAAL